MHPKFHDTDVAVIIAPNQLIVGNRKDFKEYVLKEAGDRHVLLDMQHCDYFDSSALGMLFALSRELKANDRKLGLFGLNPDLRTLFDMARANLIVYVSAEPRANAKALQELREFQPIALSPDPDEPDSEGDGFLRLI
jgi:anti-anti-sigma factor